MLRPQELLRALVRWLSLLVLTPPPAQGAEGLVGEAAERPPAEAEPAAEDLHKIVPGSEWHHAMLEDAGVAGSSPLGQGGAPAAGGGPPGGGGRPDEYRGLHELDWKIDGTNVGGYGHASLKGPTGTSPLPEGERIALRGPLGLDLTDPRARRWLPTNYPQPARDDLILLVHRLSDAPTRHLLERIADEPLFAYGARQWKQQRGARQANQEIVDAVYLRLARLMGAIYGFEPAVLAYTYRMPYGYDQWFDWDANRTYVTEQHLGGTYADLLDILAWGQALSLQRHLMRAYDAHQLGGDGFDLARVLVAERALKLPSVFGSLRGYHGFYLSYCVGYLAKRLSQPE